MKLQVLELILMHFYFLKKKDKSQLDLKYKLICRSEKEKEKEINKKMKNLTFRGIVIRKFLFKHTIEDISDAIFSRGIVFGSIDEIPVEFFSRLLIGSTFDLSEGAPDQQNTQQRCYLLHRIRRHC